MRLMMVWALGGWLAGCSADDFGSTAGDSPGKSSCLSDDECGSGETCFAGNCVFQGEPAALSDAGVVEEERSIAAYTVPAAGREHVWVASSETDTVVRIHAQTLALDTIEVGDEPTEVRAVPDSNAVVVLNRGSNELAVVRAPDDVEFVSLPGHFNALTLSPDGAWALCWFDLDRALRGEDSASLQDMAVVALDDGAVHAVTVGYRPRRIAFSADGATALVVTDDGISAFEPAQLGASTLAPVVPIAPDVFGQEGREVALTPDGAFAVSRGPGELGVTIVDLVEGTPRFVDLGAEPTDLDLLPDGRTALVMLRSTQRLALVPLDTAVETPETIRFVEFSGQVLGSAAVAGRFAVLYTTLAEARAQVSLLDLDTEVIVHRPVRKGVAGVEVAPGGRSALIIHTKAPGVPDPTRGEVEFLARSYAYSLLDLRTATTKLQITPAAPQGLVFSPERDEAFLVLRDVGISAIQRIDLNGFSVQNWALGTPPEVVGVLAAVQRAFVTQTHPEGRISFIHLEAEAGDGGRLETVSGYALNGRIN